MVVNEYSSKQLVSGIIILFLILLSFLILRPIALSIIIAALLAFTFSPVYDWLYKHTKAKTLSVLLILLFLILIIILPIWFLTPMLINQAIEIFQLTHKIDFTNILQSIFPSFFSSERFAVEIGSIFSSFTTKLAGNSIDYFTQLILNFP
ncbi:AI-2E family transporter, partial [Candidatus Pacearchaeota archaeon]|nr:AI-2E family transporter [Candidatus Pacearchaeota archaeon]